MTNVKLTDEEWKQIRAFLRDDPNVYIGKDEQAVRRFVEARHNGVYCHLSTGIGIQSTNALSGGVRMVFGNVCWHVSLMTQIWKTG